MFIVLKIRSHAKVTCIFVNCDENKKILACCFPLRLFSRSLLSVECNLNVLYLHDSTQCYEQRTTLVQPYFVVRSLRILNSLMSVVYSCKRSRKVESDKNSTMCSACSIYLFHSCQGQVALLLILLHISPQCNNPILLLNLGQMIPKTQ